MVIGEAPKVLDHGQAEGNGLACSRTRFSDDVAAGEDVVVGDSLYELQGAAATSKKTHKKKHKYGVPRKNTIARKKLPGIYYTHVFVHSP